MQDSKLLRCRNCGEQRVVAAQIDYSAEREHDGRAYPISVPNLTVFKCEECGNQTMPDESSKEILRALYAKAGLLLPEEIRAKRELLALTQKELANYLNVADTTVSRWERGGQIQQRAMDKLLRIFFDVPEARAYLGAANLPARTEEALAI